MELHFELALLKDIIEKKIAPAMIMSVDVVDGYFTEVRDLCKKETERIENTMRVAMMNIEQEKEYIVYQAQKTVAVSGESTSKNLNEKFNYESPLQ